MTSLLVLIPVALMLVGVAIAIYLWAVNNGQYQDLEREATRILHDDDSAKYSSEK